MPKFEFCLPTLGKAVPVGAEWFHEIKYDGYRLRVERDGERVRLFTKRGYDWTLRYPWIVEAAHKNRSRQFVIDGEAVVLGLNGISDFNALHAGKSDAEVQFCAFDVLAMDGEDLRNLPSQCARRTLIGCCEVVRTVFSSIHLRAAQSGLTCFGRLVAWGWRGWSRNAPTGPIAVGDRRTGSR